MYTYACVDSYASISIYAYQICRAYLATVIKSCLFMYTHMYITGKRPQMQHSQPISCSLYAPS